MNGFTLRTQEYEALAGALDQLYQPVTPEEFPAHLFRVVAALLPDTLTSFDFIDLATGKVESHIPTGAVTTRSPRELEAIVRQYLWQNPAAAYVTGGHWTAVVQPTDFVSERKFRKTDLYQLAFKPLGIKHQVAAGLIWQGRAGGFAVNRISGRSFSAREVELIRRLRPHVERAFTNARLVADLRQRLEKPATAPGGSDAWEIGGGGHGLTARELEVLHWMAEGKRNIEIGKILVLSSRTVQKHVEHILGKLGVETRTAAAAFVHRPPWH